MTPSSCLIRVLLSLLVLSVAGIDAVVAQTKTPPPPLEAYARLPSVSLLVISPSGKRIAYREIQGKRDQIVVRSLEDDRIIERVSLRDDTPRKLEFVGDNNLIITASHNRRTREFRGDFDFSVAFNFDIASGKLFKLLQNAPNLYPGQEGLGFFIGIDSDPNRILMPAFHQPRRRNQPPKYGLFAVSLNTNRTELVSEGSPHTVDWFANRTGDIVAREDYLQSEQRFVMRAYRDSEKILRNYLSATLPKGASGITPDGDALVVGIVQQNANATTYARMDLNTGYLSGPLLGDEDRDIEQVITDVYRTVHGVEFGGFKPYYQFYDQQLTRRIRAITDELGNTSATLVSWSDFFRSLVFYVSGGNNAGSYLLYREDSLKPEVIGRAYPEIADTEVVPSSIFTYRASDGRPIPALLTVRPELQTNGNLPLIMLPHGGPATHDRLQFNWLVQFFASRGYAVVQPQFRGSTGFGHDHAEAGVGEWGKKMQRDLDDAVTALVDQGLVNGERVCIVGASYGGYAALAAVAFFDSAASPVQYRCAASIGGVSDLESFLRSRLSEYGRNHWIVNYWKKQYGGADFDWQALAEISPINSAGNIDVPVLLIHGREDSVVPQDQSEKMYEALKATGKPVNLIEIDDGDHWSSNEKTRLKTLRALAGFIEQNL